ncbi:MAG TPA: hypothetical protein PKK48_01900 [Phycisphaerae bacterium]|nr:hypothetical protein [Phycisphaerae bacterium]HPS52812.1 hypothetical protein [Phycisphaerae bacterium]
MADENSLKETAADPDGLARSNRRGSSASRSRKSGRDKNSRLAGIWCSTVTAGYAGSYPNRMHACEGVFTADTMTLPDGVD